jgi:protein disulfide-isomerase A1
MDSTANEIEVPGLNVKGFPTIYFFPGDNKQLVKYEAGRELEDFVEYLEEHASTTCSRCLVLL